MIYRVINPNLENPDAAYPAVVAAVVPVGLRGLVVAAIVSAIMSTISGLVNSTATLVTLDLVARRPGAPWSEERLVRVGRWSGGIALLIGAAFAPVVMKWQNIFRYAQDVWAPMAAPVVVVFLAGAWWPRASARGAVACLWLAAAAVPLILAKAFLADLGVHFLPPNLENPMVFAGTYSLMALAVMVAASLGCGAIWRWGAAAAIAAFFILGAMSPTAVALLVLAVTVMVSWPLVLGRREPQAYLWDRTMLDTPGPWPWYGHLGVWWCVLAAILVGIYIRLW
jgi:SSS family solute:Na+ symporter